VGIFVLEDDAALARLLDQCKLLRLLAHLIFVPAEEARCLRERVPVIEGARLLTISDQGSPEFASIRSYSLFLTSI
jgi:hypothetical protein